MCKKLNFPKCDPYFFLNDFTKPGAFPLGEDALKYFRLIIDIIHWCYRSASSITAKGHALTFLKVAQGQTSPGGYFKHPCKQEYAVTSLLPLHLALLFKVPFCIWGYFLNFTFLFSVYLCFDLAFFRPSNQIRIRITPKTATFHYVAAIKQTAVNLKIKEVNPFPLPVMLGSSEPSS